MKAGVGAAFAPFHIASAVQQWFMAAFEGNLVSLPEYARIRGLTPQRIRQLIGRGRVPGARKIGRNWLIPSDGAPGRGVLASAPLRDTATAGDARRSAVRWLQQEVVPRIVAQARPDAVILFGSYAHGRPSAASDLDLCVIVKSARPFFERSARVQKMVPRGPCYAEVLAYTPQEFEAARDLPMFRDIVERGVVLYERAEKPRARR